MRMQQVSYSLNICRIDRVEKQASSLHYAIEQIEYNAHSHDSQGHTAITLHQ